MTPAAFLQFVSDIGDASVLLAVTLCGLAYLLAKGARPEALALTASLALTGGLIVLLKLGFIGCGHGWLGIRSPSGHASLSIAVFGMYAVLLGRNEKREAQILIGACAVALLVTIAFSRVMLGYHTVGEVIVGGLTGSIVLFAVASWLLRRPMDRRPYRALPLCLLLLITASLVHGIRLPAENVISRAAFYIPFCHGQQA